MKLMRNLNSSKMKSTQQVMLHEKGIFILLAGANASGKSTVIKDKHVKGRIKHYLDPDRFFVAEDEILSSKALKFYREKSMKFSVQCVDDWLASELFRKEGIATESNLLTERDFENFEIAKNAGMRTELYFVGLPLETAKEREEIRAANGDQEKIELKKLIRRYKNGLSNIQKHIDSGNIDLIKIYDNSRGIGDETLVLHNGTPHRKR